ncbi:hypothetical protein Pcinc_004489 [Petrolisthes cinctipes]|uniref:Uncharacterized protein n=1 Tax=Petrolisthes cinctipes TaxID=88211 RepID=A0AAE1GFK6_PETCI|nr:hypothetical protein Pcinc_004489 [Petrolisthes cinctipes]
MPLINFQKLKVPLKESDKAASNNEIKRKDRSETETDEISPLDESDADPSYVQPCEVMDRKKEEFAACHICNSLFLNTLSISEKTVRTALKKKMPSGTVEIEKRGGRQDHLQEEDKQRKDKIKAHIDRFPRMESHYCRSKSTRDYLHSDLNQKKMYEMFLAECCVPEELSASYTTYCDVLKSQNISFHNPKKDQCKICENFRKGDSEKKKELMCMYEQHNKEKYAVRKIKEQAKNNTDG